MAIRVRIRNLESGIRRFFINYQESESAISVKPGICDISMQKTFDLRIKMESESAECESGTEIADSDS